MWLPGELFLPSRDLNAEYLRLLAQWNRRINLTSLATEPFDDAALDRLIEEPQRAAALVDAEATLAVDLGSGGGSPAIPMKIARPGLSFVLVEARQKKCAFLRTVARELELAGVEVEQARFEELVTARPDLAGQADVVTFRAVRADTGLWATAEWLLKPDGQVFWFGGLRDGVPSWLEVRTTFNAGLVLRRL